MRAYLETIVIANKQDGNVSTSCSQTILDFDGWAEWESFNRGFDYHEKGPNFEIFRTLMPLW
ncbi:hypothetical protein fHeYen901_219 [Yersinia phage fHe-Yen9-01]|uniref:Uncharacterized protein n=1 Tax=Yersinia phage fHe-Yen9-01 TaxID=1965363 RepID=A0A1V0DXV9_9CAUD|nr:hypothetical protein KNT60_gp218 [Yersinia phage fHe-Yen9-01]ARB05992.1 hypothetical protein fHeYen901_219 [Yersinia phage fHe-Yen9-01]